MGEPSATSVLASTDGGCGGNGGMGEPSATSVLASTEDDCGGNAGWGQPSAFIIRSIVMGLPAERLTDRTTGSTIKAAKTKTATATAAFFTGGALLDAIIRRGSFDGVLCLKVFRKRNTARYENAYTATAKPQSRSGLHPDNSCRHSRAICPAGLHRFLAGPLQRPI